MSHRPPSPTQDVRNASREPDQLPKVWELHDAYKYAPPKADGDTWHILLEPLLRKDKMRCDAWKDEVQNLLIFAGLFSAVATSFAIQSYQSLQADPLANLLLVLSASQSNASTVTVPPFSPTSSSIRINIFWFTSLVLSLTTVLVGIVSLQWLREHQSYPDLTPKQIFAIFHMRSEGLQKWHVPRIFSALPLLLQASLILFFAGMIDFLLSVHVIVAIPVIVIIGLTSVFLLATTVIPTFQGLPFYFPFFYSKDRPPSQCSYKSPQSHAFRTLTQLAFRGFSYLLPIIYTLPQRLGFRRGSDYQRHLIPFIASTWSDTPWIKFDLAWLSIRDAYMQGIYDRGSDLHLHRRKWSSDLPLYDIAKGLREVVQLEGRNSLHTDTFLAAAHYCFEEMSLSIMDRHKSFNDPSDGYGNQERRNRYFRRIIDGPKKPGETATLSEFLHLNDGWGLRSWEAWEVLHHENMLVFLSQVVLTRHSSSMLSMYAMELQMRMVRDLLGKPRKMKAGLGGRDREMQFPQSLVIDYAGFKEELSKCRSLDKQADFCYQYANIVKCFFWAVANYTIDHNQNGQPLDTFLTHPQMLLLVTEAGWISAYVLNLFHKPLDSSGRPKDDSEKLAGSMDSRATLARQMVEVFVSTIAFVGQQLEIEMQDAEPVVHPSPSHGHGTPAAPSFLRGTYAGSPDPRIDNMYTQDDPYNAPSVIPPEDSPSPSLLFYVACLYIKPLAQQHHDDQSPMNHALNTLKPTLRRYYQKRITPSRDHRAEWLPAALDPIQTPSSSKSRSFALGGSNLALLERSNVQVDDVGLGTRHILRTTALEERWSGVGEDGVERFSDEWWKFILSDGRTL